jgi:DNA-binding GntR family transcriptional regulator
MSAGAVPFRLNRARSATEQVFEHLRAQIVGLTLRPGTVLARPALCDYFQLSQSPIREALLRLEEERLVDIYPQHQTRVRAIDLAAARQAHFFRLSVELEIAWVLARDPRPALGRQLTDLVARQRGCLEAGDFERFARIDMAFHKRMYDASELPDLWAMMRSCSGNLDRLRRLHLPLNGKALSILRQHDRIARCIAEGDAAGAQRAVRQHLSGTLQALDELRARFPDMLLPADYAPGR